VKGPLDVQQFLIEEEVARRVRLVELDARGPDRSFLLRQISLNGHPPRGGSDKEVQVDPGIAVQGEQRARLCVHRHIDNARHYRHDQRKDTQRHAQSIRRRLDPAT
jgi:hypothetical protein